MADSKEATKIVKEERTSSKQKNDAGLAEHDIFVVYDEARPDEEDSGFKDGHDVTNATDTTILNMYERAISSVHENELESDSCSHHGNNSRQKRLSPKKWVVGGRCLAPYSEDNMWYPAVIEKLHWKSGECEVIYEGYGDVAIVRISDLARVEDGGGGNGDMSSSSNDGNGYLSRTNVTTERPRISEKFVEKGLHALPVVAPPPPPSFLNRRLVTAEGEDVEANMLVSWYMCGYHTGYRQAVRDLSRRTADANNDASG
uniref:Tudor domain-containing protein n=1 Tax=Parascaris univalens TaxID=6257 RepID=A0A915B4U0_PARUN